MANIVDGGPSRVVPLVYYDEHGNRYVVGKAKAKLRNGSLIIDAQCEEKCEEVKHEFNIKHLSAGPISFKGVV